MTEPNHAKATFDPDCTYGLHRFCDGEDCSCWCHVPKDERWKLDQDIADGVGETADNEV